MAHPICDLHSYMHGASVLFSLSNHTQTHNNYIYSKHSATMRTEATSCYMLLGLLVSSFMGAVLSQEEPNLVIIMTDEHNLRTLGAYRNLMADEQAFPWGENVFVDTPNIDKLAEQGTLFQFVAFNFVSSNAHSRMQFNRFCRSSIQKLLHRDAIVHTFKVRGNAGLLGNDSGRTLSPDATNLSSIFYSFYSLFQELPS